MAEEGDHWTVERDVQRGKGWTHKLFGEMDE